VAAAQDDARSLRVRVLLADRFHLAAAGAGHPTRRHLADEYLLKDAGNCVAVPSRLRAHLSPWGEHRMELAAHVPGIRQSRPLKKRARISWMISASVTKPNGLAART
jgi:hypothetical protein